MAGHSQCYLEFNLLFFSCRGVYYVRVVHPLTFVLEENFFSYLKLFQLDLDKKAPKSSIKALEASLSIAMVLVKH